MAEEGGTIDLVIKVVVTLFVAIVVAGAVILFAQRTLTSAEQSLRYTGKTPEGVQIITLSAAASASDITKLADACVTLQRNNPDLTTCFIVKGFIPSGVAALDGTLVQGFPVNVTAAVGATALFISYDPSGRILITS